MGKAGWIFCKNDGANSPQLPAGVGGSMVNSLEIHRITGGPGGFEHTHLMVGGYALPSYDRIGEADEFHGHIVVWYGDQYRQITRNAPNHNHDLNVLDDVLSPDWYLIFWKGSDADAAAIVAAPDCIVAVQAVGEMVDGVEVFEDLDTTPWTPAERAQWEARIATVLALDLPDEVTSGDKLVAFFVGALVGRPAQRERWLRMN